MDISKCQGVLNARADRKLIDYIRLHSLLGATDSYRSIKCENKYQGHLQLGVLGLKIPELEDFCGVFLRNTDSSGITGQWMTVTNAGGQEILIERDCALIIRGVDSAVIFCAYKWTARQP